MLRWQRTKGFARFTHRFEIFQLPIQPCSHCNKLPLKLGMRNLPPSAFLQTHLTGQIKEAPCRLALPRFYLGREARCRTRVRINSACMGGDRNRKLAKKQPPDFGNPNCRLARSV